MPSPPPAKAPQSPLHLQRDSTDARNSPADAVSNRAQRHVFQNALINGARRPTGSETMRLPEARLALDSVASASRHGAIMAPNHHEMYEAENFACRYGRVRFAEYASRRGDDRLSSPQRDQRLCWSPRVPQGLTEGFHRQGQTLVSISTNRWARTAPRSAKRPTRTSWRGGDYDGLTRTTMDASSSTTRRARGHPRRGLRHRGATLSPSNATQCRWLHRLFGRCRFPLQRLGFRGPWHGRGTRLLRRANAKTI